MGRGAAREWIGVPLPADGDPATWRELLEAAHAHAG